MADHRQHPDVQFEKKPSPKEEANPKVLKAVREQLALVTETLGPRAGKSDHSMTGVKN